MHSVCIHAQLEFLVGLRGYIVECHARAILIPMQEIFYDARRTFYIFTHTELHLVHSTVEIQIYLQFYFARMKLIFASNNDKTF